MLTQARAKEAWGSPGCCWADDVPAELTDAEQAYVKRLWDSMPGWTCWMDAFFAVLDGRVVDTEHGPRIKGAIAESDRGRVVDTTDGPRAIRKIDGVPTVCYLDGQPADELRTKYGVPIPLDATGQPLCDAPGRYDRFAATHGEPTEHLPPA